MSILEAKYPAVATDWEGKLYCGITLDWTYDEGYVDISMPGYIKRLLAKFNYEPKKKRYPPSPGEPRKFAKAAQEPSPADTAPLVDKTRKRPVQQVVGSILYYGKGPDPTTFVALSTFASEQSKATERTVSNMEWLLDYLATNPDAKIRYYKSDMILNIHSDASYLSESRARSRAAGHYFLGSIPETVSYTHLTLPTKA